MSVYSPPSHIAIVRVSQQASERDVAFWCEAVRIQLQQHAAPAWGMPPPGVFVYDLDTFEPEEPNVPIIAIVDDDGNDQAAGFHSAFGGVAFGLVDLHQASEPSRTLSHEALELWGNSQLDRWVPGPGGLEYAVELSDACQRDQYTIDVEMFGEKRAVVVSSFVYPEWFQAGAEGPTAHLAPCDEPFELAPGGYAIARNDGGQVVYLSHRDGAYMSPAKMRRWGRTRRLIEGGK